MNVEDHKVKSNLHNKEQHKMCDKVVKTLKCLKQSFTNEHVKIAVNPMKVHTCKPEYTDAWNLNKIITARNLICGKVIFSVVFICLFTGRSSCGRACSLGDPSPSGPVGK